MKNIQSNVSLNSVFFILIILWFLSYFDFSIPKQIPSTEINTVKQLTYNIKLNEDKLYHKFTVKNMVSLNIVPYNLKTYIDNQNPDKSYIETQNGVKIYPVSQDDIASLLLKDFSKSVCYQYINELKDESYYSNIIVNDIYLNRSINNANCHLLGNTIELKL